MHPQSRSMGGACETHHLYAMQLMGIVEFIIGRAFARPVGSTHPALKEIVMSGIEGKVVAITGASSGIGEATALLLAERGAKLVLGARRLDRLKALSDSIVS